LKYILTLLALLTPTLAQAQGWPAVNTSIPIGKAAVGISTFSPKDYGADITGATDATTAIQAAQAACIAAGGGEVRIDGMRLRHNSDITVAAGCPIRGSFTPAANVANYTGFKSVLLHPSTATLRMGTASEMTGVAVLSTDTTLVVPTTAQQGAAMVRKMATAGTGIAMSPPSGAGVHLSDILVAGFNYGVYSDGSYQLKLNNVFVDAINGIFIRNSHDITNLTFVHNWPFLTASQSWTIADTAISGVADNGSGLPRVTVATTANMITGDPVFVFSVPGFSGVNTKCIVTVIDATHFDCSNLASTPTATAAITTSSQIVKLATPNVSVAQGQTVTGTGIPGGTTVIWTEYTGGYIYLSQPATVTDPAASLTFTNGTYTSGGTARITNDYRPGAAFYFELDDGLICHTCFSYGHALGFDLNNLNAGEFFGGYSDYPAGIDATAIGVKLRGTTRSTVWSGGTLHGGGTAIVHNTTDASSPNTFTGVAWIYPRAPNPTIAMLDGAMNINNSFLFRLGGTIASVFVADTMDKAWMIGDDFSGANGYWSAAAAENIQANGTKWLSKTFSEGFIPTTLLSGGTGAGTIAANSTNYVLHGLQVGANTQVREPITRAGRLRNLYVENTVAPGGTETQTITVQRNSADTGIVCQITGAVRTCTTRGTGQESTFAPGDNWNLKVVNSVAAAATQIKFAIEWAPDQ
jgi:hypothetical protein